MQLSPQGAKHTPGVAASRRPAGILATSQRPCKQVSSPNSSAHLALDLVWSARRFKGTQLKSKRESKCNHAPGDTHSRHTLTPGCWPKASHPLLAKSSTSFASESEGATISGSTPAPPWRRRQAKSSKLIACLVPRLADHNLGLLRPIPAVSPLAVGDSASCPNKEPTEGAKIRDGLALR